MDKDMPTLTARIWRNLGIVLLVVLVLLVVAMLFFVPERPQAFSQICTCLTLK